jgi:hypothetical protein
MEVTTFIWMFVVLKIPIVALLALVWWAIKEPEPVGADEDDGGSRRPDPHRGPSLPRPPRRGPHAGQPLPAPPRVRTGAVAGRDHTAA